jgi:hypothetical protein
MQQYRCNSTDTTVQTQQMQQYRHNRCNSTDATVQAQQMQQYRHNSTGATDATVQTQLMQQYRRNSTDATVQTQQYRCNSTDATDATVQISVPVVNNCIFMYSRTQLSHSQTCCILGATARGFEREFPFFVMLQCAVCVDLLCGSSLS